MKKDLSRVQVTPDMSIKEAIRVLNENSNMLILLVLNCSGDLVGTVTDGDVRRGLLKNIALDAKVERIMCREPKVLPLWKKDKALEFMKTNGIAQLILLDDGGRVADIILWKDFQDGSPSSVYSEKSNSVFVLAGGKGTRLDVFTKIIPKPLIPIGDKPMLEHLLDRFQKFGFKKFLLSVNYKADMIKMYFKDNTNQYQIQYVDEKEYLGTAGSLSLIRGMVDSSFMVSNCDVLFDMDYHELLESHIMEGNDATVVGVVKHFKIPYGVIKMGSGELVEILEKPEYDFLVNAGLYVLEPHIINLVQPDEHIDMTALLLRVKERGYKVKVYPVTNDWRDIGEWDEYNEALEHYERMKHHAVKDIHGH